MPARSRLASGTAIAVPVAIALGVVVVVGLVAGAPDDVSDVADPQHLGPRLVILALGLVVLLGLELLAFSSNRWWVRAVALPGGLLVALLLVGLLEDAAGEPRAGLRPGPPLLGSDQLLIRVAPTPALPVLASDTVAVADGRRVTTHTLPSGNGRVLSEGAVDQLGVLLGLRGAAGLGAGTGVADTPLGAFLGRADPPLRPAPDDLVVVVHAAAEPTVEIDVSASGTGELPDATVDRLVDAAVQLELLGYDVDLALPTGAVSVPGEASGWASAWQDITRHLADVRWLILPVIAALVAALVVGWVRSRTAPAWVLAETPDELAGDDADATRADLAAALDAAIEDLPLDGDPRAVIAAAYLRMTDALAGHGVERRASDTPLEYLARALEQLDASSHAVHRLTDLLQLAMFSDRAVEPAMASEAISAFAQVRDELRSPAWV